MTSGQFGMLVFAFGSALIDLLCNIYVLVKRSFQRRQRSKALAAALLASDQGK